MLEMGTWEKEESALPYMPSSAPKVRAKKDVLKELIAPCGRFNSAASWEEDINARIGSLLVDLDPSGVEPYVFTNGVPLNWQLLAGALHREGLTRSKLFRHRNTPNDLPRHVAVDLLGADLSGKTDGRLVHPHGYGRSATIEESMSKAAGELLERYFLSVYRKSDFRQMSYREILARGKHALNIHTLNTYLPWQHERFPHFVRSDDAPIHWTEGVDVMKQKHILLPAQLVYWNYVHEKDPKEPFLIDPNTNGCAGHFTFEEALLAALLELVQRDGFMVYWLNSITPKLIDVTTITDPPSAALLRQMKRYNLDFYFVDVTTDIGIPTVVCVVVDHSGEQPVFALGGSAGFSEHETIFQSASEALAVLEKARSEKFKLPEPYEPFVDNRIGRDARLTLWSGRGMFEHFKFFVKGGSQPIEAFLGDAINIQTPAHRLAHILNGLAGMGEGYECYAFKVEHRLLRSLGYHVVRATVPKLMHLYLSERNATLGAERLRSVPVALGFTPAATPNPWPHPFP